MQYGQFCPIAKAAEVIGDRWTLLIVREMLMGGTRFNTLQRGLGTISPTMLTKRLAELCASGIAFKKRIPGQNGYEYFLTESGRELLPIIESIGVWGMRWARGNLPDADLDVDLLMLYMERSIDVDKLIGKETVIRFQFTDLQALRDWWLVVRDAQIDTCMKDPGKNVDVYITTDLRTMIQAWMGDITYRSAIQDRKMLVVGPPALTRNLSSWIRPAMFEGIPPANAIRGH
jgi:DNA-binding HxlR family transcriptional regulator